MPMMMSAVADMTTITSIITTTMMRSAAVDMTMITSIITTITMRSAAADIIMIITIITQTKYSQAGDVRQSRNSHEKVLRRCLKAFPLQRNMA